MAFLRLDIPRAFCDAIFFMAVFAVGLGGMLAFLDGSFALAFFFGSSTDSTFDLGSFLDTFFITSSFTGYSLII